MTRVSSRLRLAGAVVLVAAVGAIAYTSRRSAGSAASNATVSYAAASSGGVALPAAATTTSSPTFIGQSASPEPSTIPSSLAGGFAMLRRGQSASDVPAANLLTSVQQTPGGPASRFGVNAALSRLAGSPGGAPVWFIPGSSGGCLLDASGGGGCGPTEGPKGIAKQGIFTVRVPVNGGAPTVQGILPDGATVQAIGSTGSAIPGVQQSGQAYSLPPGTVSFTIHLKDGSTMNQPMPPTGALPTAPPGPATTP